MSKIKTTCINCGVDFYRFKSYHNQAALRGTEIKFCSVKCKGEARTKGLIKGRPINGKILNCQICQNEFYRPQSMIDAGKFRFCSEPCRLQAHKQKLIDRTGARPNRRLGGTIDCVICGHSIYRKKSMIERNINKTCGKTSCISAYSRSLWKLSPRPPEELAKPRTQRKYRPNNFTAKQRADWLSDTCARCGSTTNLCLDHIIAVCRGGKNTRDNAQTLCQPCNNWKCLNVDRFSAASTS